MPITSDLFFSLTSQVTDLIIRCPLSRFDGVSMTGSLFRSARSCACDERSCCVHCSIRMHTFAEVTLQLRLYPPSPSSPRRVVCNTLLHLARMPGIVYIAPRNPWKQWVRPPWRDEKNVRETRDQSRVVTRASFINHRLSFLLCLSSNPKAERFSLSLALYPS